MLANRFPKVAELLSVFWFEIHGRIKTRMLSPKTHYKAYLVFNLGSEFYGFTDKPIEATVRHGNTEVSKQTVYVQGKGGIIGGGARADDWFELELGEFPNEGGEDGELKIRIFRFDGSWMSGVVIQGIEIRPN
ncbi:hypothetical protein SLE2022_057480 [Rubroshorea leprosula]